MAKLLEDRDPDLLVTHVEARCWCWGFGVFQIPHCSVVILELLWCTACSGSAAYLRDDLRSPVSLVCYGQSLGSRAAPRCPSGVWTGIHQNLTWILSKFQWTQCLNMLYITT